METDFRPAIADDAEQMTILLNEIIAAGGTTAHQRPFDTDRMLHHYISPPRNVSCGLAVRAGQVVGFQSLVWADPDLDRDDSLPLDWAIIATFVQSGLTGGGIGSGLFRRTQVSAKGAGVVAIDATIRADNLVGLAYYSRLGFTDYRRFDQVPLQDGNKVDRIAKRFDL